VKEFDFYYAQVKHDFFGVWIQETDNASHFKSKENLNYWSERTSRYKDFIKMVWVNWHCFWQASDSVCNIALTVTLFQIK